jgi:hypothetical protein
MTASVEGADPYLLWIVASEYYDGEMSGVGLRASDGAHVWFRTLAWDSEQWQRVFAIARVEKPLIDRLLVELEKTEPRRSPFWLPGPTSGTLAVQTIWNDIANAALNTRDWQMAEGRSLVEPVTERSVDTGDVPYVIRAIRSEAVTTEMGPSLIDNVLRRIRGG